MKEDKNENSGWFLVALAAAIISAGAIAFLAHGRDGRLEGLMQRKEILQQRNQELQEENKQLQILQERLHQDPHLIEKLAREKLGLVNPGEKVVWFKEPSDFVNDFDLEPDSGQQPENVFQTVPQER